MKGIKKQHRRKVSPQINSVGPLSDLPRLNIADESTIAAEMAAICPGNSRLKSKVEVKVTANNIKNSLKTLSYHFDFCVGEKYTECLLVDFSDYNR